MRYKIRIGLTVIGMLFMLVKSSLSQDSYAIINSEGVNNVMEYREALSNIDLDKYREDDKRRILKFTTGVEIVLYSRNEIKNGVNSKNSSAVSNNVRILKLGPNGQIAEQAPQEDPSTKPIIETKTEFPMDKNLPKSFPLRTNSGNKLADQKKYQVDKLKWIDENPEEYKRISSGSEHVEVISQVEYEKMSKEKQKVIKNNSDKYIIQK